MGKCCHLKDKMTEVFFFFFFKYPSRLLLIFHCCLSFAISQGAHHRLAVVQWEKTGVPGVKP